MTKSDRRTLYRRILRDLFAQDPDATIATIATGDTYSVTVCRTTIGPPLWWGEARASGAVVRECESQPDASAVIELLFSEGDQ